MTIEYIKKATKTAATGEDNTRELVMTMLREIEAGGEEKALEYARKLDGWDKGSPVMTREQIDAAKARVSEQEKADIHFSYDRVSAFARQQRDSIGEFEVELSPGLFAGQKLIPMTTAGCYVPGGRYAHIASAIMSVATAKVAGVENVVACSVPHGDEGAASLDCLRHGYLRGGHHSRHGRGPGHRCNGFRPLHRQAGGHSGRSREPFCGRGQADAVRARGHRPVCGADRNRDYCR